MAQAFGFSMPFDWGLTSNLQLPLEAASSAGVSSGSAGRPRPGGLRRRPGTRLAGWGIRGGVEDGVASLLDRS